MASSAVLYKASRTMEGGGRKKRKYDGEGSPSFESFDRGRDTRSPGSRSGNASSSTQFLQDEENEGAKEAPNSWIGGEVIAGGCDSILAIEDELVQALTQLKFALPVTCVYNPLIYARELHEQYVRKYGGKSVEVLLIGMNPGPYGMAQTGVPFGDGAIVRDFLKLGGKVDSPKCVHSRRPIYGLDCPRREVSGQRLWGWAQKRFYSASSFLSRFWIHNYCPLVFMEASGRNRTPDKLPTSEQQLLQNACNKALINTINIIQPRLVIGIGKYATRRIRASGTHDILVGEVIHPSPANPKANKEWANIFEMQLKSLGVVI